MDHKKKTSLVILVLVSLFVVAQGSDAAAAATFLGNFRKMVEGLLLDKDGNSTASPPPPQMAPSPGPIPVEEGSDPNHAASNLPAAAAAAVLDPPALPNNNNLLDPTASSSSSGTQDPKQHDDDNDGIVDHHDKCEPSSNKCTLDSRLIACLRQSKQLLQTGDQEFYLLVQNEGESSLQVNISVPASVKIAFTELQIPKHQAEKINVSVNVGESPTIILNAGYGDCVLKPEAVMPQGNFFQQIPSYATLVTPIYGAYFMFLIALIVGGSWACCKFQKRGGQQGNGIPYQELEMGVSGSAVSVETADGWDQSWDDDWDEDSAVKSPGGQHVGSVSANGLTSRSSSKDGWGNDWDD